MTGEPPGRDLRLHLLEDIVEIEAAVDGYRGGRLGAYQTVAIQLRNLLTDRDPRAGRLLLRVIPGAQLHALRPPPEFVSRPTEGQVTAWIFDPRGSISLGGGPPRIEIEVTDKLVSIDEWLDDWIIRPELRIRDLIHEVASKDGAHTDDTAGPAMNVLEANQTLVASGARMDMARPVIVGLGAYVAQRTRELLDAR